MFKIIQMPDWLGSTQKNGVEQGPSKLANLLKRTFKTGLDPEMEIVKVPEPNPQNKDGVYAKVKFLPEIVKICKETQAKTLNILKSGKKPLGLMSNDSSMIGLFSAVAHENGPDLNLIWFDAHGDCNTPTTTPSGKIYGMPLAHLMGVGNKQLMALNPGAQSVKHSNVILLGPRCLDPGEMRLIKDKKITHFDSKQLNQMSVDEVFQQILQKHDLSKKTFIHIDLDVLEPSQSPGVSMHEDNGLKLEAFYKILSKISENCKNIIGIDIAEYNPVNDHKDKTAQIVAEIVKMLANLK